MLASGLNGLGVRSEEFRDRIAYAYLIQCWLLNTKTIIQNQQNFGKMQMRLDLQYGSIKFYRICQIRGGTVV